MSQVLPIPLSHGGSVGEIGNIIHAKGWESSRFLASILDGGTGPLTKALSSGSAKNFKDALQQSPASIQASLEASWGREAMAELSTLSRETEPELLQEALHHLAGRLQGRRQWNLAAALWSVLQKNGSNETIREQAGACLAVLQGGGSFGDRAELFTQSAMGGTAQSLTGTILTIGSVTGLFSYGFSFIRPLRPLAGLGLKFLSTPSVAGLLLGSEAYTLYHLAPEAAAAMGRLLGVKSSTPDNSFQDFLSVSRFGLGSLGWMVGIQSFLLGGRAYFVTRQRADLQNTPLRLRHRIALAQADAIRRNGYDPQMWAHWARGTNTLASWQGSFVIGAGRVVDPTLTWGSLGLGMLGLYQGLSSDQDRGSLFFQFALDTFPGVTVVLYRAGRGNRRFLLGPGISQDYHEAHYRDPELRELALERLERSLPALSPSLQANYHAQALRDLGRVEGMLNRASSLPTLRGPDRVSKPQTSEPPPGIPSRPPPREHQPDWNLIDDAERVSQMSIRELRATYASGTLSPLDVLQILLRHPATREGAIFPRSPHRGRLGFWLHRRAVESEQRFAQGKARPLEGILVGLKDNFEGPDGVLKLGSKTARVIGVGPSYLLQRLLELGAIPVPVGMVASANGGWGGDASFGYIPHPRRKDYDPAGSSSGPAYVVGHPELPIPVAIGHDVGGSVSAPAGAVGLYGIVPPHGVVSTKGMVPSATFMDRVGLLAHNPDDMVSFLRLLSGVSGDDPHARFQNPSTLLQPSLQPPNILFLQNSPGRASSEARNYFLEQMGSYQKQGHLVQHLKRDWDFLSEIPFLLYPFDVYGATVFTYTNPRLGGKWEVPRRTLDENQLQRLPKGGIALESGYFDRARRYSEWYEKIVAEKIGPGFVLASPAPEAILTKQLMAKEAGDLLDNHDRITMMKNRIPDWGQVILPANHGNPYGLAFTGSLPDLLYLVQQSKSL